MCYHLILHLFELKGLTRMCIIVMCDDHHGLCIGPAFQYNALYINLWFLVSIVFDPDFRFFRFGSMSG